MSKTNTIAGWVLAGGIAALGLSIVGAKLFESERPEKMGYPIAGVEDTTDTKGPVVPLATLLASADAAKGAETFKKCASCHTINQGGANNVGPNLWATMGEPIATGKGGFPFSDALKKVGGTWDFDKMNAWLTSPRTFAPGTAMGFAGIPDPQERANVIVYLNSQGSNLALPPPPAAAAPADNGAEGNAIAPADPANISNDAGISANAPSQDPNAAVQAEKKGH